MRCKLCKKATKYHQDACWKKWQLCGKCATIKHPECYPNNIIARGGGPTVTPAIRPPKYPICGTCKKRVFKLSYRVNCVHQDPGISICTTCNTITTDRDIKVVFI